jgi:hypothetical protein
MGKMRVVGVIVGKERRKGEGVWEDCSVVFHQKLYRVTRDLISIKVKF